MGLIVPPGPVWSWEVDNLTGTPSSTAPGTNFTFGASNADGTAVQVLSAISMDALYMVVALGGCSTNAEDNSALVDILWDPAGGTSWGSLIDDLVAGFSPSPSAASGLMCVYHFPLWIPSGASLAVQARKNGATAATGGRCAIWLFGEPKRPDMWWAGQAVESLGISASTSKGTAHTPGNSGSYSSWATIGTSTRRYGALQFGTNGSDANMTGVGYYWQIGVGSAQLPGTPTYYHANTTNETCARTGAMPLFVDLPASTALQTRATASGTAEAHNVAFYGVY